MSEPDGNLPPDASYPTCMLILPKLPFSDSTCQLWVYTWLGMPDALLRPFLKDVGYLLKASTDLEDFNSMGNLRATATTTRWILTVRSFAR